MPEQAADLPTPAWQSGSKIGRYQLVAKLATGGMAEIWLARQFGLQGFEKVVVVKRILDSFAADPTFVHMFLDEARIAAQLNHHNVVQVYDLGHEAGAYYIAMEYLAGESLSMVIRECDSRGENVPPGIAARLIANAAEGLAYAHEKRGLSGEPLRIVHRDISPQNLFVSYEGVLKIVDFGIAKAANRATRTATGFMKGKLIYASPEQVRGDEVDGRSDIFALGVVLYECLTGKRLFEQTDPTRTLRMLLHDTGPFVRPDAPEPGIPPEMMAIVSRALDRDPEQRFPSARAMQGALEEWLRGQPAAPNTADVATFMESLFGGRIEAQQRLLQSASAGLLGETVRVVRGEETQKAIHRAIAPRRISPVWLGAGAGVVLAAGFAVYLARAYVPPRVIPIPTAATTGASAADEPHVQVDLESKPPGAQVFSGDKLLGQTPLSLEWKSGQRLDVRFELAGYMPETRSVAPVRDYEMDVTLAHAEARPPAPSSESAPASRPEAKAKHKQLATNPVASPPAIGQPGFLTVRSEPWCNVSLDGTALGATPVAKVTVSAGLHRIVLKNEGAGLHKEISVVVKPGEEVKQLVTFPMGKIAVRVEPWANVTLDGRSIGTTPIQPTEVAAGRHELRLANPEIGKDERRVVTVKEGGEQMVKVTWK